MGAASFSGENLVENVSGNSGAKTVEDGEGKPGVENVGAAAANESLTAKKSALRLSAPIVF